eukprot:311571-Chlamydomonas_euryale.AAC.3
MGRGSAASIARSACPLWRPACANGTHAVHTIHTARGASTSLTPHARRCGEGSGSATHPAGGPHPSARTNAAVASSPAAARARGDVGAAAGCGGVGAATGCGGAAQAVPANAAAVPHALSDAAGANGAADALPSNPRACAATAAAVVGGVSRLPPSRGARPAAATNAVAAAAAAAVGGVSRLPPRHVTKRSTSVAPMRQRVSWLSRRAIACGAHTTHTNVPHKLCW